jgi:transposase
VMDNLAAHKRAEIAIAIEAAGARLLYLPPYSPDLNPIEMAFAKLKAALRKAAARSIDALESVREHQAGLQSFRSMRRIDARRKNASAFRLRFSQSLASLRHRLSQAMVRSTTQRRGNTTNPLA